MDHRGTFLTTIREIHGQGFPKLRARSMPDVRTSLDKVNQYWDFGALRADDLFHILLLQIFRKVSNNWRWRCPELVLIANTIQKVNYHASFRF